MTGAERIAAERQRQRTAEGFDAEHDAPWTNGELIQAAACYARHVADFGWRWGTGNDSDRLNYQSEECPDDWPSEWSEDWWKPKNPMRDMERAGALIAAEIDRLLRKEV